MRRTGQTAHLVAIFFIILGVGGGRRTRYVVVLVRELEKDVEVAEPGPLAQVGNDEKFTGFDYLHLVVVDEKEGVKSLPHVENRLLVIVYLTIE